MQSTPRWWSNWSINQADTSREQLKSVDPRSTSNTRDASGVGTGIWNWQLQAPSDDRFLQAKQTLGEDPTAGLNVLTDWQIKLKADQMARTEEMDRDAFIVDKIWGIPGLNPQEYAPELYAKRMAAVDTAMDQQWMLAKINLQGNIGHNTEEWNLLYDVEKNKIKLPERGAHLFTTE